MAPDSQERPAPALPARGYPSRRVTNSLNLLLIATAVISVLSALIRLPFLEPRWLLLAAATTLYCVLGVALFPWLWTTGRSIFWFAIPQLATALLAMGLAFDRGRTVIMLIPLAAQIALVVPPRTAAISALVMILSLMLPHYALGRPFDLQLVLSLMGKGTGVCFGTLFAHVLRREFIARTEAQAANERLREFARQSADLATAEERNRLAREIHDNLGHGLTVASVQIEAARGLLQPAPEQASQILEKARDQVSGCLEDLRGTVSRMRITPMLQKPLRAALQDLVSAAATDEGTQMEVAMTGDDDGLSPGTRVAIYRAAQEAITNVHRHGIPGTASLSFESTPESVRLAVSNAALPKAPSNAAGVGLVGMRERAAALGGRFEASRQNGRFNFDFELPR